MQWAKYGTRGQMNLSLWRRRETSPSIEGVKLKSWQFTITHSMWYTPGFIPSSLNFCICINILSAPLQLWSALVPCSSLFMGWAVSALAWLHVLHRPRHPCIKCSPHTHIKLQLIPGTATRPLCSVPRHLMLAIKSGMQLIPPAGGWSLYWAQWSEFFAISIEGHTFTNIGPSRGVHWVQLRWWGRYVVCTNYSVSICRDTVLSLSLSLDDAGRWESSCSPRCRPDSCTGRAVGVSPSPVIRSQHQIMPGLLPGPALAVSRFCSLKLNHLHLCMSLSDHRLIALCILCSPRLTTQTWHRTLGRLPNILLLLISPRLLFKINEAASQLLLDSFTIEQWSIL